MSMKNQGIALAACCLMMSAVAGGQWLDHPTAGIPRLPNGKANLAAPMPRKANGQPDLSGIWQVPGIRFLLNIAVDLKDVNVPFQPWAAAIYKERVENFGKDDPNNRCLPSIPPEKVGVTSPWKIVEIPGETIILYESRTIFRQIFTDGRSFPKDMQPAWQGYSIGKWEGDTFFVETKGFNDKGWLDTNGHPVTDALHVIERYTRKDFGHMDVAITIDDPKAYTRPWTVIEPAVYQPDTELIEYICEENNKDPQHIVGK
jgi:hypothetical protein